MNKHARTALITGACGGLGVAIASRFAADGYHLVLTDVLPMPSALVELGDAVSHFAICDLASEQAVDALISEVLSRERIDVLINNAAFMTPMAFGDLTLERFRLFNRINVEVPFQLAKAFSASMIERQWGRIINVVSGSAWMPIPTFTGYICSKMGLVGLTRVLSHELGPMGITVNAVTPALVRHSRNYDALPEIVWEQVWSRQAIKRPATPSDFVGAIAFLASDDAAFMTGQTMAIDGGTIHL